MNLCIDCKFHTRASVRGAFASYTTDACLLTGSIDPVTGQRRDMDSCVYQRQNSIFGRTCGKAGKHFEANRPNE